MKITFFGLTISSSWGNGHATPCRAIIRALHRGGHRVVFYEKDLQFYARHRDLPGTWPYCELVLYSRWEEVRARALADAASSDVVIVTSYCPEGIHVADDVLPLAYPLRVFYDLDTPVTLKNLRNSTAEYLRKDQIAAFDLYLSFTGGPILQELERTWGARMARQLFGCVDPDVHVRTPPLQKFQSSFSYMGTYAADRQEKLERLFLSPARRSDQTGFLLAGSLYPSDIPWPSNVRVLEHVAPGDHPALYSSSRLTLNLTRQSMAFYGYCPSGRFFEAAACGTPLVSDYFKGLETFFTPGEQLLLVKNADEVLRAIDASDSELQKMASQARERTLSEHTGERRAEELILYCEEARRAPSTQDRTEAHIPREELPVAGAGAGTNPGGVL